MERPLSREDNFPLYKTIPVNNANYIFLIYKCKTALIYHIHTTKYIVHKYSRFFFQYWYLKYLFSYFILLYYFFFIRYIKLWTWKQKLNKLQHSLDFVSNLKCFLKYYFSMLLVLPWDSVRLIAFSRIVWWKYVVFY